MADQDRPTGVQEAGSDTAAGSGSEGGANAGRSVAGAVGGAAGKATEAAGKATETADKATEAPGKVTEAAGKVTEGVAGAAVMPSLDFKSVLRDLQRTVTDEVKAGLAQAATDTVAPAARQAANSALVYAATKAPGLVEAAVKNSIAPKLKEAGGVKAVAGTVLSKFPGLAAKVPGALSKMPGKMPGPGLLGSLFSGGGGDGGRGGAKGGDLTGVGRGRRLPMQGTIDVSVPVEVAYNQWTQFEEFPKFMFRVERIEQKDDTHLIWHEKIWGVRRQWEAEIVEQRPNERIVWRSTSGPQNVGVVSFHRMHDPRLTRVQVNLDFQPTGLIEKTGSGWRAAIRALDTDLKRFKAYVEMQDAATGAWRGRIKDGEVQSEEGEQQAEGEGQPEGEESEPQAAEKEPSAAPKRGASEISGDGEPSSAQQSDEEVGEPVVPERRSRKG